MICKFAPRGSIWTRKDWTIQVLIIVKITAFIDCQLRHDICCNEQNRQGTVGVATVKTGYNSSHQQLQHLGAFESKQKYFFMCNILHSFHKTQTAEYKMLNTEHNSMVPLTCNPSILAPVSQNKKIFACEPMHSSQELFSLLFI